MQRSEQINELAAALVKAQKEIKGAKKDAKNPFFKSAYADLASCFDAIRGPYSDNGLAVLQPTIEEGGDIFVETMIVHTSGQFITGRLRVIAAKQDAQAIGSAISYARRYGLSSLCGIPQIDDDGNAATQSMPNLDSDFPPAKEVKNYAPRAATGPSAHVHKWGTVGGGPMKGNPEFQQCKTKKDDGSWCNEIRKTPKSPVPDLPPNMPPDFEHQEELPF